jgi:hypothetical protein
MRDKGRYYYEPISQLVGYKVTYDGEKSEAIPDGWVKEYMTFPKRAFKLKTRQQLKDERRLDNIIYRLKVGQKVLTDKLAKIDIVPMIEAKNVNDDFLVQERKNIERVVAAKDSVGNRVNPLVLPGDG